MASFFDISGMTVNGITVITRAPNKHKETMYECLCSCGNAFITRKSGLVSGAQKSCGCKINRTIKNTHKLSGTPEYHVWEAMVSRCTNKNNPRYYAYGGRGIDLCEAWRKFENFFADMGNRPSSKHSIDRINNNLGYFKENCRWATSEVQMRNTSVSTRVDAGITKTNNGKFTVRIHVKNKPIHIGVFRTLELAIDARRAAESHYWSK